MRFIDTLPILVLDRDLRIMKVSQYLLDILGYTDSELYEEDITLIFDKNIRNLLESQSFLCTLRGKIGLKGTLSL